MVDGEVALLIDGRELKLIGSHLVVTCLDGNGELEGLHFEVLHEGLHAVGDGAEVVVVHLLVLGALMAHEGASGEHEVGACRVESLVDEEVLLLPTEVDGHLAHVVIEERADVGGSLVHGVEGSEEGCLVVERLAGIGDEDGGYAEGVVDDEDGRGGVPGRISACLERVAYAAVGEGAGIGLLLYEQLARELLHHASLAVVLHEGIVLLGCAFGKGLEPMGIVRSAHLLCPLLHACGYGVGNGAVEACAVVDDIDEFDVDLLRQVFEHLLAGEHVLAEVLGGALLGWLDVERALLECLLHDLESEIIGHLSVILFVSLLFSLYSGE